MAETPQREPELEPAPLVSIPEAPAPSRGEAVWVTARDGVRLRAALFQPVGTARGSVILSPGRTEAIEKYFEVVGELQGRGFAVLVHDWRGQGLSGRSIPDRLFGHARGWRPFLADYNQILETFTDRLARPWIALGHSMGAGLTTLALAEGEARFTGVVLSAPMLGLNTGARSLPSVRRLSYLMNLAGQSKTLVTPEPDPLDETFETNVLTHDPVRWERARLQLLAEPDLRLGGPTWGWLAFALTLGQRVAVSRRIDALAIPLSIVAAEDEKLVRNSAAKALADRAPKGAYVEVAGAFHEILMETDARRAVFWKIFDAVADQVAPRTPAIAKAVRTGAPKGERTSGAPKIKGEKAKSEKVKSEKIKAEKTKGAKAKTTKAALSAVTAKAGAEAGNPEAAKLKPAKAKTAAKAKPGAKTKPAKPRQAPAMPKPR